MDDGAPWLFVIDGASGTGLCTVAQNRPLKPTALHEGGQFDNTVGFSVSSQKVNQQHNCCGEKPAGGPRRWEANGEENFAVSPFTGYSLDRDFFRFQTRPWCQVFTFSPLRSDVAGRGSGSPRPSWTSGPRGNCRARLTCSWTSRHRKFPHMPTLGRVSGRPQVGPLYHFQVTPAPNIRREDADSACAARLAKGRTARESRST